MKTAINYILLLVFSGTLLSGCKKYLDDASVNPNSPETATPASLLTNIEVSTFNNFGGQMARRAAILVQQMAGTGEQMVQVADYQILEGDVTNEWRGIYNNVIVNCVLMEQTFGEENPYYNGITKILKAMNIGLATDMWGDVPCSEAGQGLDDNLNPVYDPQESVYEQLQSLLTSAINDLARDPSDNAFFPSSDFVFGGDPAKWTKTAWLLKARYAIHLSKKNPSGAADAALDFLANAGLTGPEDDANGIFGTGGNELNQWFAFENERTGYMKMGKFFVDTLLTSGDPRLPFYASRDEAGNYRGADKDPDLTDLSESAIGPYYGSPASVTPLATYVEALFIEAEANFILNNRAAAAVALNNAIKASLLQITGTSGSDYENRYANESETTLSLEKIMFQKYVALFTQTEVWSDWRRTGIPTLIPNPGGRVPEIPRILPTSQDERLYNRNAKVITSIIQRVWWDQ